MAHDPHELGPGEHRACRYRVAGRLLARRKHRHAVFLDLRDRSGVIELCGRPDRLDREQHSRLMDLDIGDIASVEGWIYVTDNQTLTLSVTSSQLLAKALRSPPAGSRPPNAQAGARRLQRELALPTSQQTRVLEARAALNGSIRGWMRRQDFVELEGPILLRSEEALPASADKGPTRRLALRTSGREHLRRCLLAGLERVYDLGKRFPCGGRESDGHAELTMLEWSTAYVDYKQAAHQCEELVAHAAAMLAVDTQTSWSGPAVDLAVPWSAVTVRDAILERCGIDVLESIPAELLRHLPHAIDTDGDWGSLVCELYTTCVEPLFVQPTLVYDFPLAGRELVRRHPTHGRLASDFRLVAGGVVLAEGNGELNDPREQRARARERADSHRGTDLEACRDSELELLEYGMCPAASVELHVDRLLTLLTAGDTNRM